MPKLVHTHLLTINNQHLSCGFRNLANRLHVTRIVEYVYLCKRVVYFVYVCAALVT